MAAFTYQTLVADGAAADAALSAYAKLFGEVQRALFAAIAAGDDPDELKPDFCRRYRITSRQFNAIASDIKGKIDGIKAHRKVLIEGKTRQIKKAREVLKKLSKPPKHTRGQPPETTAERKARVAKSHHKKRRLVDLEGELAHLEADEKNGKVRIAFGSRQLFRAQFDLEANGYSDHDQWLKIWRAARSRQCYVLGSKDETAGCQGCVATTNPDGTLDLRVRLPDAVIEDPAIEKEDGKYLILKGIKFAYGHDNVLQALQSSRLIREGDHTRRDGVALSWRLLRDEKHGEPIWYVHVTVDVPAPAIVTRREAGAVGADFNAAHVAVAELDRFRNVIDCERIDTCLSYKSAGQRKAILGDAVHKVVARALSAGKPVVVERLDFSAKKAALEDVSPKRSRMLSVLAYSQYNQLLKAACFRAGVELVEVHPAYTSVIGAINHAQVRGVSSHQGAACAIARRGLEKSPLEAETPRSSATQDGAWVPTRNGGHVTLRVPARIRGRHVWSQWAGAKRRLCAALKGSHRCGEAGNPRPPPLSQLRSGAALASCATGASG